MNKDTIIKAITDVMHIDSETITEETHFINDLGADSLTLVELVMRLEEDFDIEISDDEIDNLQTVKQVIDFIEINS
jgi:acyl carrier protein